MPYIVVDDECALGIYCIELEGMRESAGLQGGERNTSNWTGPWRGK